MEDMRPQGAPENLGEPGHEPIPIPLRGIVTFAVCLVLMGIAIHFLLGAVMTGFSRDEKRSERRRPALFAREEGQFPEPRNQVAPVTDLSRLREREAEVLNGYGWVDRKAGIARIPIDRAIRILAEKGLPKGKTTAPRGSRTREQP